MPDLSSIRSLTVTSKGQVTLSSTARKQLGIEQGTGLIEVIVGDCLVLLLEATVIERISNDAQDAAKTVHEHLESIVAEARKQRAGDNNSSHD